LWARDRAPQWPVLHAMADEMTLSGGKTVLHVSSAHRVSDGRIARKEAAALSAAGYDVTVLGLERASGTILPEGPRFVEYDVPSSRVRRFLIRLPWVAAYCLKHRFDVYHLHDPDLILLGFILKIYRRQVIYDVHEAYPMVILDRQWIPRFLRAPLSRLWRVAESAFVRSVDLTVAAHEPVERQFGGGRVITVHNYPIVREFAPAENLAMGQRPNRVIYHGDLTAQRGLFTMTAAVAQVDPELSAELRLGGTLAPELQQDLAQRADMRRIQYLGWLDKDRLAEELSQARAGLVLLHPTNNYKIIRPNKLYEYMAAGLPVIASDFPHWREVVEAVDCGLLVDPLDPSAIAQAINYLLTHPVEAEAMGRRGRDAVMAHYNWASEGQRLVASYDDLFGSLETRTAAGHV
jgi:glycosyltransferase involved in cell wall biosynthesis